MGNMKEFTEVIRMLNMGRLSPVVDRVFPTAQIREAHDYLTSAKQFGKVALTF